MKTVTEFTGMEIREAYFLRSKMVREKREEKLKNPAPQGEGVAPQPSEVAPQTDAAPQTLEAAALPPLENAQEAQAETTLEATPTETVEPHAETSAPAEPIAQATPAQTSAEQPSVPATPALQPALEQTSSPVAAPESASAAEPSKTPAEKKPRLSKEEWRKLQEQKRAAFLEKKEKEKEAKKQEWAQAFEEIKETFFTKLKEQKPIADEKLPLLLTALDIIDHRYINELRRVVVLKPENEKEVQPKNTRKVGDHVFQAIYLLMNQPPEPTYTDRDHRGGRNKGGKGRGRNDRNNRGAPSKDRFGTESRFSKPFDSRNKDAGNPGKKPFGARKPFNRSAPPQKRELPPTRSSTPAPVTPSTPDAPK